MNIALRILPVRESDDHFVVSASSTDGAYPSSVRTLSAGRVRHLLDSLQLEPGYLTACRAHVDSGRSGIVLTESAAFEEALLAVSGGAGTQPT